MSDQLTNGRRFRILAIVDGCTRERLALIIDTSLGHAGCPRIGWLIAERGRPRMIVSDNGSEFTSNVIFLGRVRTALHCARQADAEWTIESFNGRLRDELLMRRCLPRWLRRA
ncbi:hypothetical protein ACVDG8_001775 [Mesorhizobium sp. ORM8.1]